MADRYPFALDLYVLRKRCSLTHSELCWKGLTMKKTHGKTKEEREKFWTEKIEAARAHPVSIKAYCRESGTSINSLYQWMAKLKPFHPEWDDRRPGRIKNEKSQTKQVPETQVSEVGRRRFTEEFKARILKLTDNAAIGEVSSILRKEGLYSSHLQKWRAERAAGALHTKKRGPKSNPLTAENKKLKMENERLKRKLQQQEMLLDLQKKVSEILNVKLPKLDD